MSDGRAAPAFNRILDDLARRQLLLDFQIGSASSAYEVIRSIGAGAFGIVCEANDVAYGDKVAIKKIGHASATPTLARRTLREIRVLRHIKHENIVRLRDTFRVPGSLGMNVFMVMDLMEGSLHHVIHGTREFLDYELIAFFTYQTLRGLKYLHGAGIAHRDIKPSNLLVNSNCHLRIADFGMAKLALRQEESAEEHCFYMTQHVATLPYRAPELLFVMSEHSTAVDIWAVGTVLAEMILRRELFPCRSVSEQIKTTVIQLGTPSQKILNQILCTKTRQFIESLGDQPGWEWSEIMAVEGRDLSPDAIDLIKKLMAMEVEDRLSVDDAIHHPFLQQFQSMPITDGACPFRVKMDMAAVETLSHDELIEAIAKDIRSSDSTAEEGIGFSHASGHSINSMGVSSAGSDSSMPDSSVPTSPAVIAMDPLAESAPVEPQPSPAAATAEDSNLPYSMNPMKYR